MTSTDRLLDNEKREEGEPEIPNAAMKYPPTAVAFKDSTSDIQSINDEEVCRNKT